MVVPLHQEQDWMPVFSQLGSFTMGDEPVVFLSPHPDDETLAAGGLLAALRERGVPVTLVAVTDGENAYQENAGLADLRAREQTVAVAELGIASEDVIRLHVIDSSVTLHREDLIYRLLPLVSRESHLVAPWPHDFHPDHEACGEAAQALARRTGARLTYYFFWTWHRGTPALCNGLALQSLALTEAQQEAKKKALAIYVSQLSHPSGDPILHDIHLWPARLPFEVFLPA